MMKYTVGCMICKQSTHMFISMLVWFRMWLNCHTVGMSATTGMNEGLLNFYYGSLHDVTIA